jgi:hypothetical protein
VYFIFNTDAEGWSEAEADFEWINTDGVGLGCLFADDGNSPQSAISFDPVMAFVGDPFSCYVKVTATAPDATPANDVTFRMQATGTAVALLEHDFVCGGIEGYDSGWIRIFGAVEEEGEVNQLEVGIPDAIDAVVHVYVDNIYFLQSDEIEAGLTRSAGGVPGVVMVA